jgi:hypothetical protein
MQLPQNVSNNTYRALVLVDIEDIPKNMPLDVFTQGKIKNLRTSRSFITSNSTTLLIHQIVFTYDHGRQWK